MIRLAFIALNLAALIMMVLLIREFGTQMMDFSAEVVRQAMPELPTRN